MIIIYVLSVLIAIIEFASVGVYGWLVSKEVTEVYMSLDESKLRLNQYNTSIIAGQPAYITTHFSLFAKYHIEGLGTVPRFSKLEKRIKQYYAIALKNGQ